MLVWMYIAYGNTWPYQVQGRERKKYIKPFIFATRLPRGIIVYRVYNKTTSSTLRYAKYATMRNNFNIAKGENTCFTNP